MGLANSLQVKGLQGDIAGSEQVEGTFNKMEGIDKELEGQDERSVKNEDFTKEDIQNIELEEENMTKNDLVNGVQTSELSDYKSDRHIVGNKHTHQIPEIHTPTTSDKSKRTAFDKEVYALLVKTQTGNWRCVNCNYESKNKGHVKEHAERHIEGYSHECKQCDSIFSAKVGLRTHKHRLGH